MKPNTEGAAPGTIAGEWIPEWRASAGVVIENEGRPEWVCNIPTLGPVYVWECAGGEWRVSGMTRRFPTKNDVQAHVENEGRAYLAARAPAGIVGEWEKELRGGLELWVFWNEDGKPVATVTQGAGGMWRCEDGVVYETKSEALRAAEKRGGLLLRDCVAPAPATGIKHDAAKPRWDLVPWESMIPVVSVLTSGAQKYAPDNWRKVPDAHSRYFAAALRHMTAWWGGEINDPETNQPHLAHATCCLLFLIALEGK